MKLSVIIPTYNRKEILKKCLAALFNQTYNQSEYEVIVIDDGSTDGTEELVKSVIGDSPCVLRYFRQENRGPAAARNVGIKNANGKIVLFIGDDIIADKELLKEHIRFHEREGENVAVLGYVTYSPELKWTPFLRYLDRKNVQFSYSSITDFNNVSYKYFFTANISVKRIFMLKNGLFDEDFKYAAYEDTELGFRLEKKGLVIKYNKDAVGYHYHPASLNKYCKHKFYAGYSAVLLSQKHPGTFNASVPKTPLIKTILKACTYPVIKNLISFIDSHVGINFFSWYGKILDYYRFKGIKISKTKREFDK